MTFQRTLPDAVSRPCGFCGSAFVPNRKYPNQKFCSPHCQRFGAFRRTPEQNRELARTTRKKNGDTQRGRGEGKSYRKNGGQHEHRTVMEQMLGRKLERGEVVHHKDGDFRNNAPDNLELLPSQADHARLHFKGKTKGRICTVDGCTDKHQARGLCRRHYNAWYHTAREGVV